MKLSAPIVVVPNITGTTGNLTEDKVLEKCFDLLFAFDEVTAFFFSFFFFFFVR
jgi:hypothetical protein